MSYLIVPLMQVTKNKMSIIIRYVDTSSSRVSIEESFLGLVDVNDTTRKWLFDVIWNELKQFDLDIDDVRGQGYDNESNIKGGNKRVQNKFLDVNPKSLYSACGFHSVNLTLCGMAKNCGTAKDFFRMMQRIYTTFANFTKKWQILEDKITWHDGLLS